MKRNETGPVCNDRKKLIELDKLIVSARNGENAAFAEIVRRFRPSLLRRAFAMLGDKHLAEDAVQETLIEAYRELADLRVSVALSSWMSRILFKYCDRIVRKQREIPTAPERLTEIEDTRTQSDAPGLIAAVSGLDYTIAHDFYILGKSQREIAQELEIPLHTVKNRLKKTRQNLQRQRQLYITSLNVTSLLRVA